MSDNAPIFSKKMVGKWFPATTVVKGTNMKAPTKTVVKTKVTATKGGNWGTLAAKKVGNKAGTGKAMPRKAC